MYILIYKNMCVDEDTNKEKEKSILLSHMKRLNKKEIIVKYSSKVFLYCIFSIEKNDTKGNILVCV